MKIKEIFICLALVFLAFGCQMQPPNTQSIQPSDLCPLPSGYDLNRAIVQAKQTLSACPEKLEPVFMALIDIGKHNPRKENREPIYHLIREFQDKGTVSKKYSDSLYNRYFSPDFEFNRNIKGYQVANNLESIKSTMLHQLKNKKEGLVEFCGPEMRNQYSQAEQNYTRTITMLEDLSYTNTYVRTRR